MSKLNAGSALAQDSKACSPPLEERMEYMHREMRRLNDELCNQNQRIALLERDKDNLVEREIQRRLQRSIDGPNQCATIGYEMPKSRY